MKQNAQKIEIQPKMVFYSIVIISILLSFISIIRSGGSNWVYLYENAGRSYYNDFFDYIQWCRIPKEAYANHFFVVYPALGLIPYVFLGKLLPAEIIQLPAEFFKTEPYAILLYGFYLSIIAISLSFLLCYSLNKQNRIKEAFLLSICLMCSGCFIAKLIERGNSAYFIMIMLFAALLLRQSQKKIYRELSLILIAAAAGMKIYPALIGLLYLKEKRLSEAIRLLIYGLAGFFVPFVFFGNLEGFTQFIQNNLTVQSLSWRELSITSLPSLIPLLLQAICGQFHGSFEMAGKIVSICFGVIALIAFWKNKSEWKSILLLISVMAICPVWSGGYTIGYYVLPLVSFILDDGENPGKWNNMYALLFSCVFSLITFNLQLPATGNSHLIGNAIRYVGVYGLPLFVLLEGLKDAVNERR